MPSRIVLAALLPIFLAVFPGVRARRERDRGGEESDDSPV